MFDLAKDVVNDPEVKTLTGDYNKMMHDYGSELVESKYGQLY